MALFRIQSISTALLLAAALNAGSTTAGIAAQDPAAPPELSADTSDLLNSDFRPAYDGKDWDKSLAVLDSILTKADPESYDAAYVHRVEGTIYLQGKNNQILGLQHLEQALAIDDRKHYFNKKDVQEIIYSISQTAYGEAVQAKDLNIKARLFTKALQAVDRWIEHADLRSLNQDNFYYIAVVYFTFGQGTELGPDYHPDRAMMEKTMTWIDRGLQSVAKPHDTFYQLKIAGLYQLGRLGEMADYIELQVKQKPDNKGNWQELASIYQQLASSAEEKKDAAAAFSYYIRVILTFERAQKLGFMNTPRDNFNLVSFYSNINQFSYACERLDAGLKDNTIESTPENWAILGGWYQLIHRDDKAVHTFITAAELFPTNAEIEYQLAQVYLGIPDEAKAFEHIKACIAKGGTAKPHVAWLFYSYTAMDLQKYDEALKAAREAVQAAKKIGAADAVKQAEQMVDTIAANKQDLENRKLQLKH